ncbi:hypothetical protein NM2004085_2115 [Neisseria meningitidis 2004085]|nr:hypothetical protein NM2004085_2115 [Neisseria meningitidis 2004085]
MHNGVRFDTVSNLATKSSGRYGISHGTTKSQSAVANCKSLAAVHNAESGPKCCHCRASGKICGLLRAYSSKFRLVLMAIWLTCGLTLSMT